MKTKAMLWTSLLVLVIVVSLSWSHSEKTPSEHELEPEQEFVKEASIENGKTIYYSGYNLKKQLIPIEDGPHWLYMHGGSCVDCHGKDGKGGIYPMMCYIETPPTTFKSLTSDKHGAENSHGKESDDHAHETYTIESIRKVLEEGVNPAGKELNECMPRWKFSDEDFRDLIAYLIELDNTSE